MLNTFNIDPSYTKWFFGFFGILALLFLLEIFIPKNDATGYIRKSKKVGLVEYYEVKYVIDNDTFYFDIKKNNYNELEINDSVKFKYFIIIPSLIRDVKKME